MEWGTGKQDDYGHPTLREMTEREWTKLEPTGNLRRVLAGAASADWVTEAAHFFWDNVPDIARCGGVLLVDSVKSKHQLLPPLLRLTKPLSGAPLCVPADWLVKRLMGDHLLTMADGSATTVREFVEEDGALLIITDVGRLSGWQAERFQELLGTRYQQRDLTVIETNDPGFIFNRFAITRSGSLRKSKWWPSEPQLLPELERLAL